MTTTAYIAGPMRGIPEFNFPRFMAADALLSGFGWHVFNPARHDLDSGSVSILDPGYLSGDVNGLPRFDLAEAFRWDEAAVTVSDALVLLDGWALSSGAQREYRLARSLDKDIFRLEYHEDRLQPWVLNGPLGIELQVMDDYTLEDSEPEDSEPEDYDDHAVHLALLVEEAATRRTDRSAWANAWFGHGLTGEFESEDAVTYTLPATKEQWLRGEQMVVDPETGGAKGSKLARFDLLPYDALLLVAEHFGKGASKYQDRNWERGYDWGLSMAALQRHLAAFWSGEDVDEETGSFHLQAVVFHALALLTFQIRDLGTDSRGTVGQ
jgi:hypothetical protein